MKFLKQEIYFPIIVLIHLGFWAIDLYMYDGSFVEVSSSTLFFGELNQVKWSNIHRILGEIFSSWVVTVFAFNFLMATRARWVERIFGGLDKMYLIHRRSGVIAVTLLIAHFITVPRDLTEFTLGKPLGFYAFVLILIGVVLSAAPVFKKKLPYHKWINIHRLMGIFYVMGVVHGLMVNSLIRELPITRIYVFGMSAVGIVAWVYRAFLFRIVNPTMEYVVTGNVAKGNGITEIELQSQGSGMKYHAGQFAFFKFPDLNKKEQHPFTISSHPDAETIRVTVKDLGDYTNKMADSISVGDKALVEGPYGQFSSEFITEESQVWVAGGIGITPFLALLHELGDKQVHLFWCVSNQTEAVYTHEIQEYADRHKNFTYTVWSSSERGFISAQDIYKPQTKSAYMLCGPAALKTSIRKGLIKLGVSKGLIYEEEFAFR